MTLKIEDIARITHEANRAYCLGLGDGSQVSWDEAPEWQKQSAVNGVTAILLDPEMTPEDSHLSWLKEKLADGWRWGPVKDPLNKEHPCMVSYGALPAEQQAKDRLFLSIVRALSREVA